MKPILSNSQMVRAILDGKKTVTRRAIKPQPVEDFFRTEADRKIISAECPICQPGDVLWVRETWAQVNESIGMGLKTKKIIYRANYSDIEAEGWKWRPSIHMPREAARIFLRVTDVRVERLQDSFTKHGGTIFKIRAEGINIPEVCRDCIDAYGSPCCINTTEDDSSECGMLDCSRSDFADLWDSTIKPADRDKYGWDANPWVWVITFEQISKEEALK